MLIYIGIGVGSFVLGALACYVFILWSLGDHCGPGICVECSLEAAEASVVKDSAIKVIVRTKLRNLDACFVNAGGNGVFRADGSPAPHRTGVGLSFRCPCGQHDEWDRIYVGFSNPIDGGPALESNAPRWYRTGDTIDTITLQPSIQRLRTPDGRGCRWHGYVTNGEAHGTES